MNHKAKAIQLLGEKITKKLDDTHIKSATYPNGYNQMHSKAVEVVVGLLEETEKDREARVELSHDYMEVKQELQSLKNKLTVEKLAMSIHSYEKETFNIPYERNMKEYLRLAQALIKELKSTNDK